MQAIASSRYGAPADVLAPCGLDVPTAGAGEVVVRVQAASVNPADWHLVRGEPRIARLQLGLRRPKHPVLGCDLAGTVHAVGTGVDDADGARVGDEVYGSPFMRGFGAFAEYARVPADCLAPKPAGLSFAQAAAVPLAGLTALQALRDHGRLRSGERVLVLGASGGVGTFAVQVARALGAEVTGVCSTRNVDLVRSLGADHVVDRTAEDVADRDERYDVIVQVSGTHGPAALRRLLAPGGRLVQVSGDSPGRWLGAVGRLVGGRVLALASRGDRAIVSFTVAPRAADLRALTDLIDAGRVAPVVEATYPLAEVPAALAHLEAGRARGKVVIAPIP